MPQSMQVVRGLLAANPDYWPAKTNADGTTSSAYLRATVYEDRPRVRQKDGSYTDNPLGPVRTTVKFWGQAAELLPGRFTISDCPRIALAPRLNMARFVIVML